MKLAFIGIGKVGFALADNLQKKGHQIIIAHDNPRSNSVISAMERNSSFDCMPVKESVEQADIVFLATPFKMNEQILNGLDFQNKTLIDCTNPVGPGISHGLRSEISGAEMVAKWAHNAQVVKAYTIYGYENLVNTQFKGYDIKPAMLIAGNDVHSKSKVRSLNDDLHFETIDVGNLSQSLHLEHMTLLWVKMVRVNGHNPNFTWAYLERE